MAIQIETLHLHITYNMYLNYDSSAHEGFCEIFILFPICSEGVAYLYFIKQQLNNCRMYQLRSKQAVRFMEIFISHQLIDWLFYSLSIWSLFKARK